MSGSLALGGGNIPIGYQTPRFPSLQFPVDGNPYESPLLYRMWDIYRFTVFWHLIIWTGAHVIVGSIGSLGSRKQTVLMLLSIYLTIGALYAFSIGSIIGLLLAAVYRAGAMHMTTWIPFAWSILSLSFLALTNFNITSYVF